MGSSCTAHQQRQGSNPRIEDAGVRKLYLANSIPTWVITVTYRHEVVRLSVVYPLAVPNGITVLAVPSGITVLAVPSGITVLAVPSGITVTCRHGVVRLSIVFPLTVPNSITVPSCSKWHYGHMQT